MALPYSMHDREGNIAVPSGGFGLDLIALKDNPAPVDYRAINPNINWLVRVDWSNHGEGTFPGKSDTQLYITRAFDFILKSQGFYGIVLGNEPNHPDEAPDEGYLTPEYVAWLFSTLRNGIKSNNSSIRFFTPAVAPYRYDGGMPWTQYLTTLLVNLQHQGGTDGTTIHAYARSMDPSEATSQEKMGAPLEGLYYSFQTYKDALEAIPGAYKNLPCFLTEFNVIPDWENKNTGIVKAVYKEIANHNSQRDQKVFCLTLFRWKYYEGQRWGLENKPEVLKDFREAIEQGAGVTPDVQDETIFILSVGTGQSLQEYPLAFDPEAQARGVQITPATPSKNDTHIWKVVEIQYLDEQESQGRHHFYFDTVDEAGNRVIEDNIAVWWSTGGTTVDAEEKKGEPYSANYPMSTGKNAYSAKMKSQYPSDVVSGVGMGADTPSGWNAGIHTSTFAKFQLFRVREEVKEVPKTPISLAHPVENPRLRVITQSFGENPDDYKRFKVDNVPLRGHNGLDFGTPVGSIVDAVDDGVVVENAFDATGYGNYIKLRHSWGESLYAHLSQALVSVGEAVKKGQNIGLTGSTGNSTGPHLHYAMRVSPFNRADGWGGYTDPSLYFAGAPVKEEPSKPSTQTLKDIFKQVGEEFGFEWELLASQAWAESSFDPEEVNGGLMQITDDTWHEFAPKVGATDIDDPLDNARVGAAYLKYLKNYYEGNIYNAVLAYNHGMGNVDRKVPTSEATRKYVDKVFHGRDLLKALGVK